MFDNNHKPDMLRIAEMPTLITQEEMLDALSDGAKGAHESLTRAYHVLAKVRYLLEQNTAPGVILECIDIMQSGKEPEEGELSESRRYLLHHLQAARWEALTNLKMRAIKQQEFEAEAKARAAVEAEMAGRPESKAEGDE